MVEPVELDEDVAEGSVTSAAVEGLGDEGAGDGHDLVGDAEDGGRVVLVEVVLAGGLVPPAAGDGVEGEVPVESRDDLGGHEVLAELAAGELVDPLDPQVGAGRVADLVGDQAELREQVDDLV